MIRPTRTFLSFCVHDMIRQMSEDLTLDLDVKDCAMQPSEDDKTKFMKVQVRVRNILQSIAEQCSSGEELPAEMLQGLGLMCRSGGFLPTEYLSGFEFSRLAVDHAGSVGQLGDAKCKMLIGFFMITNVLVRYVVLHPEEFGGLEQKLTDGQRR